jgi:uncharacterized protein (TIGR02246 family)
MKVRHLGSLCAAVIAAFVGGSALPAFAAEVRPEIEAANAQFSAMAAKRDAAGLAALYAADGQLLPAGSDVIRGREEIQKFWQVALDSGIAGIALKTMEVFAAGSTATEVGQYELRDAAGKVLDQGKYIVIWRHEGHNWRLLRDMFSTNASQPKKKVE